MSFIYFIDCVECMANSDNVIRAGLTPKLIDVDMLLQTLTYICRTKEQIYLKKEIVDRHAVLYRPPVNEFAVLRISVSTHRSVVFPYNRLGGIEKNHSNKYK